MRFIFNISIGCVNEICACRDATNKFCKALEAGGINTSLIIVKRLSLKIDVIFVALHG
jgi:hypothetical protein